jgi:DNA-binding CsgD family transcriptional regulator
MTTETFRATPRETQILTYVAEGHTSHQIAVTLALSVATVRAHMAHAMAVNNAKNRAELASMALRAGAIK